MPQTAVFWSLHRAAANLRQGPGLAARKQALRSLAAVIRAQQDQICAALAQDFAKPRAEVILTEILPVLQEIRHALHHLPRWMRPQRKRPTLAMLGTFARVQAQPRGVCLIMAPWNYPFALALGPLVSALAAGNRAIVKPSEITPATSALIARIVAQALPVDLASVVEGGREAGEALLDLPFDHIFFTGSPDVGQKVMAAAARHLASVTLELGGKSPTIVGPDADLAQAAAWIAFGKFANAGQTCIAPDHVYVHAAVKDRFLAALRGKIAATYGSGFGPDLAHIVNDQHAARLAAMMKGAVDGGAHLLMGGAPQGRAMPPTVIENLTPEMALMRAEIFGPILPIIPYTDLDGVLAAINARPKPLTLYIFAKSAAMIGRVLAATTSGSVGVNLTMAQFAHLRLPFGGIGRSGMGAAHGQAGFEAFSHRRAVLRNRLSPLPLLFAPYTARVQRLIALALRFLG